MNEVWKPIENYEGYYEISNTGKIKSLERKANTKNSSSRKVNSRDIKLTNNGMYYVVGLAKSGRTRQHYVHRLVAQAFIPNPENLKFVNHKDGDKLNNKVDNLEWCTIEYNNRHAFKNGLIKIAKGRENKMFGRYGKNANKSKPVYQYDLDYNFIKKWDCQRDVQRELGFSEKSISNCVLGNQKTAYGYIWLKKLKESVNNE